MSVSLKNKREKLLFCLLVTFLWGLAVHGYRFFNLDYSHDSLLIFQELDYGPMMSVGRFMQPVYFLLRGNLYAPALVGLLSLSFLGVSVYLVSELLNWQNRGELVLLGGIMTVNSVVSLTAASYIHDLDLYMLALLLAVWSVVLCRKGKLGPVLAVIPAVLSLGLYQSYIQAAIILHMILAILALLHQEHPVRVFADGMKAVCSIAASLVIYYCIYRLGLRFSGVAASANYNTLTNVGAFEGGILYQLGISVYMVIRYFLVPWSHQPAAMAAVNVLILLLAFLCLVRLVCLRKLSVGAVMLLAALVVLMPFAINVICFLGQGVVHGLMMYACVFVYVLAAELFRMWLAAEGKTLRLTRWLMPLLLAVTLLLSTVYANQIYLKKSLESTRTVSVMTRILDRIEQTDGYVYGQTPVAFAGLLHDSPLNQPQPDFDDTGAGLWSSYSVTSPETYGWYIRNVLNYEMNILDAEQAEILAQDEVVIQMPVFPQKDSVQMIDGVIIVKLSEATSENQ